MQITPERRSAFELLRQAVVDLEARGRQTVSAGVKPEMQRKTLGGFDERKLGYPNFAAFLAAAEQAGVIARTPTAYGNTLLRALPSPSGRDRSRRQAVARSTGADAAHQRLRRDLWHAFVDWRKHIQRVYDRESEEALMHTGPADMWEGKDGRQVHAQIEVGSPRYVPIEPIPLEQQLAWIHDFVEAHGEHPLADILRRALGEDRPIRAFSHLVRVDAELLDAWHNTRLEHVASVVEAWAAQNEIVGLDVWQPPRAMDETNLLSESRPQGAQPEPEEDRLRQALHAAVDRMTMAELHRLAVPVEYLLGKGL